MSRKYPRVGETRNLKHRRCSFCEHASVREVHVQTTWTRGDDEVFHLCRNHDDLRGDAVGLLLAKALLLAPKGGGA